MAGWYVHLLSVSLCAQSVCMMQVKDMNQSFPSSRAEQKARAILSELVFAKLASLVYNDKAAYTPAAVHRLCWQVLSGMCTNQFHIRKQPSDSSPEASESEPSSDHEEQQILSINSMLLHLLLPILRHAIKTFIRASEDDTNARLIGKGAVSFCIAKLALMLNSGHPASQEALKSELWHSGKLWHLAHISSIRLP